MPPFLRRGPRIENTAAGECFGERQKEWVETGGAGFKDVMDWGSVHLFGLCIMWHTSITEKAQGLQSLIHRRSVEPAGCRFAWFFGLFFLPPGCEAGSAEGASEGRVVGATIGGRGVVGWHVAGDNSRLSAYRQGCCSRGPS